MAEREEAAAPHARIALMNTPLSRRQGLYEHKANHFSAFLTLAATLTCHKKLRKAAT